jgi:hypothetical protein
MAYDNISFQAPYQVQQLWHICAKVRNEWSYTFTPHMLSQHAQGNFTFYYVI